MLNQSFTYSNLKKLSGKSVVKFNDSGLLNDDYLENEYLSISDKLKNNSYEFDDFRLRKVDSNSIIECGSLVDELVLKKLNDNIKRLFKIHQADRSAIVKQVISLLKDSQPFSIIRLDFKSFYESVNRKSVVSFVHDEWLLSHSGRTVLNNFSDRMDELSIPGLPRGLAISSTLSELYLRPFDKAIRKIPNIYYYERFVDDIVVFCFGSVSEVRERIERVRQEFVPDLTFNDKTEIVEFCENQSLYRGFDFLGYRFNAGPIGNHKEKREVKITISKKKITKIKKRVERSIRSYYRNGNSNLLLARLSFLSGNQYVVSDIERSKLKSGIYFNYPLITDKSQLKHLDVFFQKTIRTEYPAIRRSIDKLKHKDMSTFVKISKLSFMYGYEKRVMNNFSYLIRKKIRKCW
ncbi:antiviral reverse transcriptase Drt3a [Neptuniibacter sp. PT8_73]|uniref:antiviral reverse transcriptase Drt3a n=1 Tax=Neptuniibacter sp. PT8_73 TaxID=3398206 RepID=UPI0039F4BAC3